MHKYKTKWKRKNDSYIDIEYDLRDEIFSRIKIQNAMKIAAVHFILLFLNKTYMRKTEDFSISK